MFKLIVILFAVSLLPGVAVGQDYYQNLLGYWHGSSKVLRNGKLVEYPIDLEVTAEPAKSRIRMLYKYLHPTPSSDLKFLKFQPDKEQMERSYADSGTLERYRTMGLKQFVSSGSGSFTAVRKPAPEDPPGVTMKVLFHVEQGILEYEWQRSESGKGYATYSVWSFHR